MSDDQPLGPSIELAQIDTGPSPAARTGMGCLGVIGGMVCYYLVMGFIAGNFIEDRTGGAAMLLAIGPYPMIAFVASVTVAVLRKGFLWTCAAGVLAAVASIVLIKMMYGV